VRAMGEQLIGGHRIGRSTHAGSSPATLGTRHVTTIRACVMPSSHHQTSTRLKQKLRATSYRVQLRRIAQPLQRNKTSCVCGNASLTFTGSARTLGVRCAYAITGLTAIYAVVPAVGGYRLPSPDVSISGVLLTLLEQLILVLAPTIVALMVALHAWAAPEARVYSGVAIARYSRPGCVLPHRRMLRSACAAPRAASATDCAHPAHQCAVRVRRAQWRARSRYAVAQHRYRWIRGGLPRGRPTV